MYLDIIIKFVQSILRTSHGIPEHVAEVPPGMAVPGHVCEVAAVVASYAPNPASTIY